MISFKQCHHFIATFDATLDLTVGQNSSMVGFTRFYSCGYLAKMQAILHGNNFKLHQKNILIAYKKWTM